MANGRENVGGFRVGKYIVKQVPLNIVVVELSLAVSGKNAGLEVERVNTATYHRNYEDALNNLFNRLVNDNCAESTKNSFRTVMESIKKAKEEILEAIKKEGLQ